MIGRKRITWLKLFFVLLGALVLVWIYTESMNKKYFRGRKIFQETTTPQEQKTNLIKKDITGYDVGMEDLSKTTPKFSLPEKDLRKLKNYISEKKLEFLKSSMNGSANFVIVSHDKEILSMFRSVFNNDRGIFVFKGVDPSRTSLSCEKIDDDPRGKEEILRANSVFDMLNNPLGPFEPGYVPSVCSIFPTKMSEVEELSSIGNNTFASIYAYRDPRSRILNESDSSIKTHCSRIRSDFEFLEKGSPNKFIRVRYEDLLAKPKVEFEKLFKKLGLSAPTDKWTASVVLPGDWKVNENSLSRINKWQSKLSLEEVKSIENECRDVISKMEYHLIS